MIKKGVCAVVCLTVLSAIWAWAAIVTNYNVQTKTTNVGGTIKVRNGVALSGVGAIRYTNLTTAALVDVTITPDALHKISAVTKNGVPVAIADPNAALTLQVQKQAPADPNRPTVLPTQSVVATFAVKSAGSVVLKTWQLQTKNNNPGGTITTTRGTDPVKVLSSVGQLTLKNYADTTPVNVVVAANTGYAVDKVLLNGNPAGSSFTVNPTAAGRVFTVIAYYKKLTNAVTISQATGGDITPHLVAAPVYGGFVNLVVMPSGSNNLVNAISVTGQADVVVEARDNAGNTSAPFTGPVQLKISNVKAPLTVTASYGADHVAEVTKTCANTCHLNSTKPAVLNVPSQYAQSLHAGSNVTCISCHQTMPGPDFSTAAAREALCAGCHAGSTPVSPLHGAAQATCSTCHSFGDSHKPTLAAAHDTTPILACGSCHTAQAATFAVSQHGSRTGKATWYNDHLNDPSATELQKGFGNYVNVAYTALPCGKCHNAAAWTPVGGTDQWAGITGGQMVCVDCHGNRVANVNTTSVKAPVAKATCFGCHSRQANETAAGLTDVHFVAGMGCSACHSTADMHGDGSQSASQLAWGTISAQCENCHGAGKSRGAIRMDIAEHTQHIGNIACSTCHTESMITCHNCHFDNEAGAGGASKAKFFSGRFGGTMASGNSWRFLVNRVMPDGTTKVYPGSMQSLAADYTVDNAEGGQTHTHAGIAPYYSHTITRINALKCDKCHGIENAVKLAAGQPIRVTTWNAAQGVAVPYTAVQSTFTGPKGVIPVPENPRGKLLMDFVDLTTPNAPLTVDKKNSTSDRVLLQKDGPDTIHMHEAYVKPLSSAQVNALAMPYRAGATDAASAHASSFIGSNALTEHTSCAGCHTGAAAIFATSQHGTRQGKATWYSDNLNNAGADELQKGFGNYVQTAYTALPCGKCHSAAAWTVAGVDQWAASTGGVSVCTDCHGNKVAGNDTTTVYAPVTKSTCFGCHSRQANETAAGLSDVHFVAGMGCTACHSTGDLHGTGTQTASQLAWGTISAQCENCHGAGKARGPISNRAEHVQHAGNIACSTCHAESMITCHNCHFDNEAGAGGALKAKFFSGRFGGTVASGNSWRYLVNRVMPDGSTKVYPGSMQSLVADHTVDGTNDGQGHTHAGIAPYYSHTITRVNALTCDKCHGIENAVKLAAGVPVRVTTWNAAAGARVTAANVAATFTGPKGVIPVPENPRGKLLMDFVDLTDPELGTASDRVLFQKDGPDTIHMPEAYVKPLSAAQMNALAMPYREGVTTTQAAHDAIPAGNASYATCSTCHTGAQTVFNTSLHYTRAGKDTFYNDNLGNAEADSLQKGFGNYVNVAYDALPCAACHNASDNGPWDTNSVLGTNSQAYPGPVCTDCHGNNGTTSFYAPINGTTTCWGCHSRQKTEYDQGLRDVHMNTTLADGRPSPGMTCSGCHSYTDLHGDGSAKASQLDPGAVKVDCEKCHSASANFNAVPEHSAHLANIACSTCHMTSVITCYGCHFDNEAGAPGALHAKFASGKFGGAGAAAWRFLVNRVMPDGSTKIYPASMQSLVADYTAANAPGEDGAGWTHAAIAPYYSHSITKVNALKCDKCHGIQNAINLRDGQPVRVVKWGAAAGVEVPVGSMGATYTVKPSGIIPVPENPVGKLLMDFVDLANPAAGPLNAAGTSPSNRVLFKADGPDTIHMPEKYVKPLTASQIEKLATPQVR